MCRLNTYGGHEEQKEADDCKRKAGLKNVASLGPIVDERRERWVSRERSRVVAACACNTSQHDYPSDKPCEDAQVHDGQEMSVLPCGSVE